MSLTLFFLLAAVMLVMSSAAALNATSTLGAPVTVSELNVNQYTGLWYQMYADKIVYASFEKDSFCDTALYGLNGDGTISVHNYAKTGSPSGTTYVIDGYAYVPDSKQPGQLKVHFDSSDAAPFDAPYWVLSLGPVVNNQYDWAIVSDNLSAFLFVLARDVATFKAKYQTEVLAQLDTLGFKGLTKPIATYQEKDCVYESTIRQQQIKNNAAKAAQVAK